MSNPKSISRDTLTAMLRVLGVDPENVKSLTADADGVEVVEFALNEHGARYVECQNCESKRYATHTTHIPVRDKPRFAEGGFINGPINVTADDVTRAFGIHRGSL